MLVIDDAEIDQNAGDGRQNPVEAKITTTSERGRPAVTEPLALLACDTLLTEEERLIRDTVRAFVDDRLRPVITESFEQGVFPRELAREFGDLGVLGMHLRGYDCTGASAVAYGLACLELESPASSSLSRSWPI